MARPFTRRAGWIIAALAVVAAAGYFAREPIASALAKRTAEVVVIASRPAQPVRVTQVSFGATETIRNYTGTIRPQDEAPLGFRLAGKLTARLVEVGDRVTVGQILARLDDTDARLELAAAEAEADAARTDLDRARAEADRSRTLFGEGHVAKAALDRAISAEAEALSRTDRTGRAVDLARNRLSYTVLVAGAAGVVTSTLADAGEVVGAGQPILSVAGTDHVDVVFALPEQDRNLLADATATATLRGHEDHAYHVTLRDISPDVEPVGRTYQVRMTLAGVDDEIALGRTMTLRLAEDMGEPTISLPLAAVMDDGMGAAVWRLAAGADKVERVDVEIASLDGQVARVRGPLAEGDLVVSLGAHKVDPARPVRVVETAPVPES